MSTHQKILDSVFFGESFGSESRTLLRRVFDVNQLEKSVESKEVDLVNSLNPLGFISRELSIFKEFMMTCHGSRIYRSVCILYHHFVVIWLGGSRLDSK